MLNPFKLFTIYSDLNKIEAITKEKGPMTVSKISQIAAIVVGIAGALNAATVTDGFVHQHVMLCAVLYAVAQLLHAVLPSIFAAPNPDGAPSTSSSRAGMILMMLALGGMCASGLHAQTASSTGFAGASDAVAIHYNGAWSVGTHVTESYDFLDFGKTKSNHLYVVGHELLAPTPGISIYAGGVKVEPDLSAILKKTNLPTGNFGVSLSAALGNGVPTVGGSHISFLAGGGVKYQLTNALTWQTLQAGYGQFGGNRFAVISTGLSFLFGKG